MKFTKQSVSSIKMPHGKSEHFEWDDDMPGFGIRLRGDKATWVVGYRVGGRQRRASLGDIRKVALDGAKKAAQTHFAQVKLGVDPAAKKEAIRAEASRDKNLFAGAVEKYLDHKKGLVRPSTFGMMAYDLERLCKPLAKMPVDAIELRDIASHIRTVVAEAGKRSRTRHIQGEDRAGRIMGERVRGHLSGFFKWAMGEGMAKINPVVATNNPGVGIGPRNRILTDMELSAIWSAAGDMDAGKIVKLLLLTGCRRGEVSGLRWDEINMRTGVMTIDGERTKNGQVLELTLPPLAMDILRAKADDRHGDFVFGDKEGPFINWSYSIAALHLRIAANGYTLKRWTLHDLRRTMRTGMGKLGVPPHVAERVINHTQPGIITTYDQYGYAKEKQAALLLWEKHLRENVISVERLIGEKKLIAKM